MENNLILVSNWEKVENDDFYLTDEWKEREEIENIKEARKLQKEDNLFTAFIVKAKDYALYSQMDADQVFIDKDGEIILRCEGAVINNNHIFRTEYDY
jgi:hypothetical protein